MARNVLAAAAAAAAAAATAASATLPPPAHLVLSPAPAGGLPVPTAAQLKYGGTISALIHYNMATYFRNGDPGCDSSNWNIAGPGGANVGSSNPASFAPTNLNVSSWIESMVDIGASWAVLTAKHGCGFLLYDTNTTLPDGTPYPYKVPANLQVMRQFVDAATAAGIGTGFYYSLTNNFFLNVLGHSVRPPSTLLPGQANVTQDEFEALAIAQMQEIWTAFGPLTEVWLDGGCGDLCDKVAALVKQTLAADAVAFNGGGGTSANAVRWCGTEGGAPAFGPGGAVWSTANCSWCPDGSGSGCPPDSPNAAFYPSGVDVTLQEGDVWFYEPGNPLHSLSDLAAFYHNSVGRNGHLEIDFAVSRVGDIDPAHAAAYRSFGAWIRACYGAPIATGAIPAGSNAVTVTLPAGATFDRVSMVEDLTAGQVVIDYVVEYAAAGGGSWTQFSAGTTIGSKRIDIGAGGAVAAGTVRLTIKTAYSSALPVTLNVFSGAGCATQ